MDTKSQNRGVLIAPKLTSQYVSGVNSPIVTPKRQVSDWTPFLPDQQPQSDAIMDTMACLTFSGLNTIETQVNHDIVNGVFSKEATDYFTSAGYMVNGKFKCSARYSAKMNGTTAQGNYAFMVADSFVNDGLLPESDLPFSNGMTFSQFYTNITPQQKAKAKLIYKYISVQHQETSATTLATDLLSAPVQVCTPVCSGWDSGNVVGMCLGNPDHATMIYGINTQGFYEDFDSYAPYRQLLAGNYELISIIQFVVQPCVQAVINLKKGVTSPSVAILQQSLKDLGYFPSDQAVTTYFGAITDEAVRDFQRENNLVADGIWGTKSQTLLNNISKKKS